MLGINEEELGKLRKDTFSSVASNIIKNHQQKTPGQKITTDHHGDHRSIGAESYPGVKLDKGEPVSFGYWSFRLKVKIVSMNKLTTIKTNKKVVVIVGFYLPGIYPSGDYTVVSDLLAPAFLKTAADADPEINAQYEIKILIFLPPRTWIL